MSFFSKDPLPAFIDKKRALVGKSTVCGYSVSLKSQYICRSSSNCVVFPGLFSPFEKKKYTAFKPLGDAHKF
jgi:hypothetical protein